MCIPHVSALLYDPHVSGARVRRGQSSREEGGDTAGVQDAGGREKRAGWEVRAACRRKSSRGTHMHLHLRIFGGRTRGMARSHGPFLLFLLLIPPSRLRHPRPRRLRRRYRSPRPASRVPRHRAPQTPSSILCSSPGETKPRAPFDAHVHFPQWRPLRQHVVLSTRPILHATLHPPCGGFAAPLPPLALGRHARLASTAAGEGGGDAACACEEPGERMREGGTKEETRMGGRREGRKRRSPPPSEEKGGRRKRRSPTPHVTRLAAHMCVLRVRVKRRAQSRLFLLTRSRNWGSMDDRGVGMGRMCLARPPTLGLGLGLGLRLNPSTPRTPTPTPFSALPAPGATPTLMPPACGALARGGRRS
ncbi:hypothetical protein B0H11DRAFT_321734 [Mycena galericulata]|nr:hypothetical protein B0H11DRAFT_321734 [Mycena galericulata]